MSDKKPYFICAFDRTFSEAWYASLKREGCKHNGYSVKQHPEPLMLDDKEADAVATNMSGNMDLVPAEWLTS